MPLHSFFDLGIALSYYLIPLELFMLACRAWRNLTPLIRETILKFCLFICACATGHLLEAINANQSAIALSHALTFAVSAGVALQMPAIASRALVWISEAQLARRELLASQSDLRRINAELEQFAYAASHDLRTPIRGINGLLMILERRLEGKLGEPEQAIFKQILQDCNYASDLVAGILTYSRAGRGQQIESVALDNLLSEVLSRLKPAIEQHSAIIQWQGLPTVQGDRTQLSQALENLITNALKYRSEQRPEISIACQDTGDRWVVSVQDNGIGVAEEYQDQLFLMFRRLHGREIEGTGIGLATVRKIAERHGGNAWIESEGAGRGSKISFSIAKS